MKSTSQETRTEMSVEEMQRMNAMDNAIRHRIREESAEDVVNSARKYLDFLQGK
jgi:hypothetical protein